MRLARGRRRRATRQHHAAVCASSLAFGILVAFASHNLSSLSNSPTSTTALTPYSPRQPIHQCRVLSVFRVNNCHPSYPLPDLSNPCRWTVHVNLFPPAPSTSISAPASTSSSMRSLRAQNGLPVALRLKTPRQRSLTASELSVLRQTSGCRSATQCNTSIPCNVVTPEDPSDAFWVEAYNHDSKFVVLFNVGFASLVFYVAAIIADGSLFQPHRPGFAVASATILILLGLSALLYVLVIPPNLQFALYGGGLLQSFAYICAIILIASILPAIAVTWISVLMFLAFLVGFLFEHVLYVVFGTIHFIVSLMAYQFSNTVLNLRFVYFRDLDEDPDLHRQLLELSTAFLRRVRNNWFMTRIPRMLGHTSVQLMENSLPEEVFEQIEQDPIPHIDFEALDHPDTAPMSSERHLHTPSPPPSRMQQQSRHQQTTSSQSPSSLSPQTPSSPHSPQLQSPSQPQQPTDTTPLLQPHSTI